MFVLGGCGQSPKLSDNDKMLVSDLGFDSELVAMLRTMTDSSFSKASGNPDSELSFKDSMNYSAFISKNIVGISVRETPNNALAMVSKLRQDFEKKGYFIYISESNFGYSPDEVTVLKTNDKFDLLRFEGSNGINYDIFVEDVIAKLTIWDKNYGLDFIGVGFDFIQAGYTTLPQNINEYAQELYEFCPDIVDQGVGTVEALEKEIVNSGQLYLWWD
jgi:hypothetical protein